MSFRISTDGRKFGELQIPGSLSFAEAQETLNNYASYCEQRSAMENKIKALQTVISVMARKLDYWHERYPSEDWRQALRMECMDEYSVFMVSPERYCEAFFLPQAKETT